MKINPFLMKRGKRKSLFDNYKSLAAITLFIFISLSVNAQVWQRVHNNGVVYDGIGSSRFMPIPTGCGSPSFSGHSSDSTLKQSAVYFDTCANTLYNYNPSSGLWDSVSNSSTIAGMYVVNVTKNATADSFYVWYGDGTYEARPDSIGASAFKQFVYNFFRPLTVTSNGVDTFDIKTDTGRSVSQLVTGGTLKKVIDSLGGGSQNLQQVTDVDSLSTHIILLGDTSSQFTAYRDSIAFHKKFNITTGNAGDRLYSIRTEKYGSDYSPYGKMGEWNSYISRNWYNSSGRPGEILTINSYNTNDAGGVLLSGEGAWSQVLESDYNRQFESYQQVSHSDGSNFRPFAMYISKDTALNDITFAGSIFHVTPVDTASDIINVKNGKMVLSKVANRPSEVTPTTFIMNYAGTEAALQNNGSNLIFTGMPTGYGFDHNVWSLIDGTTDLGLTGSRWRRLYVNSIAVGTSSPDSTVHIVGSFYNTGGVRMTGLPTAVGTKALRIDAATGIISMADTTSASGGTVTNIATGLGLSGGTITSSGTLLVDTASASILSRQRAATTYAPININGTVTSVTSANGNATVATTTTTPVVTIVSAPKLQTARNINGTSFDGSADITVTAAAGTLTGTTLNSSVVTSSLTSVGTVTTGTWRGDPIPDNKSGIYALLGGAILAEPVAVSIPTMTTNAGFASQQMAFVAVYIPKAVTITGVKFFQATQGNYTANNYNGVGLYSYSGGTLTLVASSTDDGNIWKATTNTWSSKAFSSTYAAAAGIYYIGALYCSSAQTTAPALGCGAAVANAAVFTVDFTNSAKLGGTISSLTALPSPTQASSGITATSFNRYLALY